MTALSCNRAGTCHGWHGGGESSSPTFCLPRGLAAALVLRAHARGWVGGGEGAGCAGLLDVPSEDGAHGGPDVVQRCLAFRVRAGPQELPSERLRVVPGDAQACSLGADLDGDEHVLPVSGGG